MCWLLPLFSDTSSSSSWSPLYGGGTSLDQEAIQYIHKFYCKDCRMEAERAEKEKAAATGTDGKGEGEIEQVPPTSPQSTLEEMSLQQSMDKNKECKQSVPANKEKLSQIHLQNVFVKVLFIMSLNYGYCFDLFFSTEEETVDEAICQWTGRPRNISP